MCPVGDPFDVEEWRTVRVLAGMGVASELSKRCANFFALATVLAVADMIELFKRMFARSDC